MAVGTVESDLYWLLDAVELYTDYRETWEA